MTIAEALGKAVVEFRVARNLTQRQTVANMGYNAKQRTYLSKIEMGRVSPRLDNIVKVAEALGVKAHDLVRRVEELQATPVNLKAKKEKPPEGALPNGNLVKHPVSIARRKELGRKLGTLS